MLKRFRIILSSFLAFIFIFTVSFPAYSESAVDFEAQFREMDIEDLQETSALLLQILNEKKVANAKLFLEPAENTLAVGKSIKLSVSSDEREVTAKTQISFESSDESIAVVNNGTVTGKAPGTASVTATAIFEDGATIQASSSFTIVIPVSTIKTEAKKASVLVGNELDITSIVSIVPEDATEKGLVFSVDDDSIAAVSKDGKLQGIKAGSVNLTIASAEKTDAPKSANIAISVNQPVTDISLDTDEFDIGKKKKHKLSATLSPDDATDKTVSWVSSNETIAAVSKDGTVTAKSCGECDIVCTSTDGSNVSAKCHVVVKQLVTSVKLSESKIVLSPGSKKSITSTIKPTDATSKDIVWKSSNEKVATVDKGKIVAVNGGDCVIICKTTDGSEKQATVSVHVPTFSVTKNEYTVTNKNGLVIPIEIYGNQSLSISNNSSCFEARLNENGIKITPKKAGTGSIKITNAKTKQDDVTIKIIIDKAIMYMSDRELIEMAKGYFSLRGGSYDSVSDATIEHKGDVSYVYLAVNFHCYVVKVNRKTGVGLGLKKLF